MTEKSFWKRLRRDLKGRDEDVTAWKVQDAFNAGLPDVSLRVGAAAAYLELKYVKEYPVRSSTNVWIGLSANQRQHLREWRGSRGDGLGFVLLGVGRDWYLLDPEDPYRHGERNAQGHPGLTREELERWALARGEIGDWTDLLEAVWEAGRVAWHGLDA